jgi:arylsulfatase A-like enzyme
MRQLADSEDFGVVMTRRLAALLAVMSMLFVSEPAHAVPPPDVILVVLDDVRWDAVTRQATFSTVMPTLAGLAGQRGTVFTQATTVNSLCCPGRASIQTGTWSRTTGVYTNGPKIGQPTEGTTGGYSKFREVAGSTVATWLDDVGYRTALYGKSFNGSTTEVPPGWDEYGTFLSTIESNEGGAYYDYDWAENGTVQHFGTAPAEYSTDMTAGKAEQFLRTTPAGTPAFLYWAPFASHGSPLGTLPAPRHANAFSGLNFGPQPPSRGEADVSDKPAYIQERPIGVTSEASWQTTMRTHVRPLAAVDDGIAALMAAQRARGRYDQTALILVGDNGYARGEHRWGSKKAPYEETVKVPMVVVAPAGQASAVRRAGQLVSTADVAPTIADYGGTAVPAFVEGGSMAPIVAGARPTWRADVLIEHLANGRDIPTYCAVRSPAWTYVVYADGFRELYDNLRDPWQLQNVASDPSYAATVQARHTRLANLCSPRPPGMPPL